jgi:hypothetical protein
MSLVFCASFFSSLSSLSSCQDHHHQEWSDQRQGDADHRLFVANRNVAPCYHLEAHGSATVLPIMTLTGTGFDNEFLHQFNDHIRRALLTLLAWLGVKRHLSRHRKLPDHITRFNASLTVRWFLAPIQSRFSIAEHDITPLSQSDIAFNVSLTIGSGG